MSSKNENIIAGIFLVGLLLGGIILLAKRPQEQEESVGSPIYLNRGVRNKVKQFRYVDLAPETSRTAKHYQNTKEWNITYNEDGLPTKIVKHVDAEVT